MLLSPPKPSQVLVYAIMHAMSVSSLSPVVFEFESLKIESESSHIEITQFNGIEEQHN